MPTLWVGLLGLLALVYCPAEAAKNYASALSKSILFYDAQRSGPLPANNPVPWRGDSALNDCVVGGWYDAGDHVKFGLPMSSSTTLLLWGLIRFKDGYIKANQLNQMLDSIKWPLDYFLRAWNPSTRTLTVQVGDGYADHEWWGRPEDMTMSRPCQTVTTSNRGSDVAAGTAAALAAGAVAFMNNGDTVYSDELLVAAESLYDFAKTYRGIFYGAASFYSSSGDRDELCEASIWLYKATRLSKYLNDARSFVDTGTAWALSWDDKRAACQLLLYEETHENQYRSAVVNFLQSWQPGGGVSYTPCGLAWRDKWGANRYAGNVAFLALLAGEMGIDAAKYRKWAVEQVNFLLGDNNHAGGCFSYVVGYGNKYPLQPHHRSSSCPSPPQACNWDTYNLHSPNPHVLNGALVGGPDQNDNYVDLRSDYVHNEVATDYNSGFQGALAGAVHLEALHALPSTNNRCPCNQ